jgi:hypothetical protein
MGLENKTEIKIPKLEVGEVIEGETIKNIIFMEFAYFIITERGGKKTDFLLNRIKGKEKEYNLYLLSQTGPDRYKIFPKITGGKKYFD